MSCARNLPEPFASMKTRCFEQHKNIFQENLSEKKIQNLLNAGRSGERDLHNYVYSLLGPVTLLLPRELPARRIAIGVCM